MERVYCAGPLFNEFEKEEMSRIARALEREGYETFLPHRDGLEFSRLGDDFADMGIPPETADRILEQAIFCLDVYELCKADAVVANLNGRVPDEGTVVEAALAWRSAKPLVLYKSDSRSLLSGSDNPMVSGLGEFRTVNQIASLPQAVRTELKGAKDHRVKAVINLGKRIAKAREDFPEGAALCEAIREQFQSEA